MKTVYTKLLLLLLAVRMTTPAVANYFQINGEYFNDTQNYSDILGDGGSLSYNANRHTLTMNNCTDVTSIAFYKETDTGQTPIIKLVGENVINVPSNKGDELFGAIYNQYGNITIDGEYTGSLTMKGSGLYHGIQAGISGDEFDGGTGYTGFTVIIMRCDLRIEAKTYAMKIPEGNMEIIGANTYLHGGEKVGEFMTWSYANIDDNWTNTTNTIETKRWVYAEIDMGSNQLSDRPYSSLKEALSEEDYNIKYISELYVTGAISGKDLNDLRIAATSGELERLDLSSAHIRFANNPNLDTYAYGSIQQDNELPYMCFNGAKKLSYIMLPSSTKSIQDHFLKKTSVERILIPPLVTFIDFHAFDSEKLKIVDFYDSFGSVMSEDEADEFMINQPFVYNYLEAIRVGEEVEWYYWNIRTPGVFEYPFIRSVNGVLFSADMKTLISFPSYHKTTDEYGYSYYTDNYTIPETVEDIGVDAFISNYGLNFIAIPENVKYIEYAAFGDLQGYKRIILPDNISYDSNVFSCSTSQDTYNHLDLFLLSKTPIDEDIMGKDDTSQHADQYTIRVPYRSLDAYKASDNFKDFDVRPMLVGTGATTPFYYDKPVFLSMSDFASREDYGPVNAYIVVGVDENTGEAKMVDLNPGNGSEIPANTAVVVKPTRKGGCYPFDVMEPRSNAPRYVSAHGINFQNYLIGVSKKTTVQPTEGNRYNYKLSGNKFKLITSPTSLSAGSVYLQVDVMKDQLTQTVLTPEEIEQYNIPTTIDDMTVETLSTEWRNLNGQRVNTPQRGVYINNGRKVIFR